MVILRNGLISTFIFYSTILFGQIEKECMEFHKGRFVFEANDNEVYLIKRTRKKQKELRLSSGERVITKIEWLNECSYRLTYDEYKNKDSIEMTTVPIIITIHKVENETCFFKSSGFDDFIVLEGSMRKISRREYRRRKKK